MQHTIKSCLSAVITAGWILLTACESNAIDPLSGKYPEPENYALNAVLSQNVVKGETTRSFTLELGAGSEYLSIEFVGNRLNYFLAPGSYTIAGRGEAKAGNYVAGDTYWVTSGAKLKLINGTIFVELTGETYTIRGVVMLEDGSIIKIAYTGVIVFEADPPSFTYSIEAIKPYAWTADGTTYIPVEGSQLNKISVLSDGQSIAYFEIVTEENPSSLTGTYPVKAVNSLERAVVQGQYLNLAWFGVPFDMVVEGGSYYMEGETKLFIREGNIHITDSNGALSLTATNLALQDIASQGAFGNLPAKGSINITDATQTGGGGGDAASLPEGVYSLAPSESAQLNNCIAGYPSLFGSGFMGTFVGNVTDGVATEEVVTGGSLSGSYLGTISLQ
jgi:hypothetical protein